MNGAEAGCGEGDEEPGVFADRGRDGFAADQSGADEVEGVSGVEAGAGRADVLAAVAAADEEAFSGFVAGVVVAQDFAGGGVAGGGVAGEVDGVGAAAGRTDLFE